MDQDHGCNLKNFYFLFFFICLYFMCIYECILLFMDSGALISWYIYESLLY